MSYLGRPGIPEGTIHVSAPSAPPGTWDDEPVVPCCDAVAYRGAAHCSCWEPVFDLDQQPLRLDTEPEQRAKCCHDCAYRPDSPERQDGGDQERDVMALAYHDRAEFWCHQGVRRALAYRHPDGREVAAGPGDYQPPEAKNASGVACIWRADGSAGERCAGWAAHSANTQAPTEQPPIRSCKSEAGKDKDDA